MRRLPSGRLAASRRLMRDQDEVMNLRGIRTSEAKFAHQRGMRRLWGGSKQEQAARGRGKK